MMYNLTVDEAHTFFVGDGQWLVHNTCDFYLVDTDDFAKFADIGNGLPPTINTTPGSNAAYGLYDVDGSLKQIRLYDNEGRMIYDIDKPDGNQYDYWHIHDSTNDPGNPLAGRGCGAPCHKPVGNHGSFNDLVDLLENIGFNFDDWKQK